MRVWRGRHVLCSCEKKQMKEKEKNRKKKMKEKEPSKKKQQNNSKGEERKTTAPAQIETLRAKTRAVHGKVPQRGDGLASRGVDTNHAQVGIDGGARDVRTLVTAAIHGGVQQLADANVHR